MRMWMSVGLYLTPSDRAHVKGPREGLVGIHEVRGPMGWLNVCLEIYDGRLGA